MVLVPDGHTTIEQLQVGDRVLTESSLESGFTDVVPDDWRLLKLTFYEHQDLNRTVLIHLLRPQTFIENAGISEGSWLDLELEEMGIQGVAQIEEVLPCPPIEGRAGQVILARFERTSSNLFELSVSGLRKPLTVTATHLFYSSNRSKWVQARELIVGEFLRARHGDFQILEIKPLNEAQPVNNIEVEKKHTYYVTIQDILSHNNCLPGWNSTNIKNYKKNGSTMSFQRSTEKVASWLWAAQKRKFGMQGLMFSRGLTHLVD